MPVTQTLNESLGTMPSGRVLPLTDAQLGRYLRENYKTSEEETRKQRSKKRLDLYRDRGRKYFEETIDNVFDNSKVKQWRKKFIEYAEFQNVTKRVIREISTVYSEPAVRKLRGKKATEDYKQLQQLMRMDRRMRQVNRLGNLLNNVLVRPLVRRGEPMLDVVTPDRFYAIAHPNDPTMPVGYIIETFPRGRNSNKRDPHYLVLDGQTTFRLDADWIMIDGTRIDHEVGRLPALLYSRDELEDRILDSTSGQDLISAHLAVALLNTLMMRDQKSGTKQSYATGDLSTTAVGQPMDPEHMLQLGEGVTLNTLDLGADPTAYINAGRAVIKQVAANYGIPESVFDLSYQATSGFEIELKRVGLREVRRDQILDFRPFERDLAEMTSNVLKAHSHESVFELNGWSIDFGEIETPQDPVQKIAWWKALEGMDLSNRIDFYQELNPEATRDDAVEAIAANQQLRIDRTREFQAQVPSAFSPAEGDNPPTSRDGDRPTFGADDEGDDE